MKSSKEEKLQKTGHIKRSSKQSHMHEEFLDSDTDIDVEELQ